MPKCHQGAPRRRKRRHDPHHPAASPQRPVALVVIPSPDLPPIVLGVRVRLPSRSSAHRSRWSRGGGTEVCSWATAIGVGHAIWQPVWSSGRTVSAWPSWTSNELCEYQLSEFLGAAGECDVEAVPAAWFGGDALGVDEECRVPFEALGLGRGQHRHVVIQCGLQFGDTAGRGDDADRAAVPPFAQLPYSFGGGVAELGGRDGAHPGSDAGGAYGPRWRVVPR